MSECGHSLFCLADVASEVKCVCSGNQRTKGQANGFIGLIQQRGYHCAEASWNVVAHSQKPDFVFRRNGRVHLNRRGASVQSTTGSRGVRVSGSNAGYTMFRGSVKGIGYPLHSPVSPFTSPPVRHRVPSHFNWTLMLDTPCSEVVWRVLATHSSRQFPRLFPSDASPFAITFQLESIAGYIMFRGSVKGTGYPLHSPVSPSLPLRCVTVCHHISTGVYFNTKTYACLW